MIIRTTWSPEEDARLLDMKDRGLASPVIAACLKRPAKSVASRYAVLMKKDKASEFAAVILCNRCKRPFKSKDRRENRRCRNCDKAIRYGGSAGIFEGDATVHSPGAAW